MLLCICLSLVPGHAHAFLYDEVRDYTSRLYGLQPTDRLFTFTKSFLVNEIKRIAGRAGLEPIRVHDLRHSHVSLSQGYFWDSLSDCLR